MIVRFKAGDADCNPDMWEYLHPDVKYVFETLAFIVDRCGLDLEVTSMIRPKNLDSGIHETGRAIDCVWRTRGGASRFRITPDNATRICAFLGFMFRRPSSFPVAIYHQVGMGGYHFHLQVDKGYNFTKDPGTIWSDLKGSIPTVQQDQK